MYLLKIDCGFGDSIGILF